MHRRYVLALAAGLASGLAGCGEETGDGGGDGGGGDGANGGGDTDGGGGGDGGEETDTPTETEAADNTPTPLSQPDPMEFSGNGAQTTDRFELAGGMVVAEYEHTGGQSNFIVKLLDPSGDRRDHVIANEIGETQGVWGQGIPQGERVMDIDADGDWSITLRQPRVAQSAGESVPHEREGDASDDWLVLQGVGLHTVTGQHSGEGNFIVESYTRDGERHTDTLIFNEIGNFEGETSFRYEGATFITVKANGGFSLKFTQA